MPRWSELTEQAHEADAGWWIQRQELWLERKRRMNSESVCTCGHKVSEHVFTGPDEDGYYEPEGCLVAECHCPYPQVVHESSDSRKEGK